MAAVFALHDADDASGLDDAQVLDRLADSQALLNWAQARQAALITELHLRDRNGNHVVDLVAVELAVSTRSAHQRLNLAAALASTPALADAMKTGRVDATKVREIHDALSDLGHDTGLSDDERQS
ncbi:MAG: DUF222 domain-containing protein [Candidatus Nanopelagicales bacterium]